MHVSSLWECCNIAPSVKSPARCNRTCWPLLPHSLSSWDLRNRSPHAIFFPNQRIPSIHSPPSCGFACKRRSRLAHTTRSNTLCLSAWGPRSLRLQVRYFGHLKLEYGPFHILNKDTIWNVYLDPSKVGIRSCSLVEPLKYLRNV